MRLGCHSITTLPMRRPVLYTCLCLLTCVGVWSTAAWSWPTRVAAQDPEPAAPAAPAEVAPAPVAAAAAPTATTEAPPERKSRLRWFYDALGLFYSLVFLGLSFALVALFVMNVLMARRDNVVPPALVESFEQLLNEKKYQEAYELAKSDDTFLGHVLAAGLGQLKRGYQPALEAMQEVGEEENMKLDHRLGYIALIGTIAPMVGLLGTVDGMVASFTVIAESSTTPKPSELAQGISTALVTTLVGLWLAIPAIAIHNILKNRISRLVLEVGVASEALMSRFSEMGKKTQA